MGTKYSSTLPTGYNSNPPADDGSQVASNKVKYSTIKSKLADPLNTYASSLDTALQAAFDTSSSITSVDYTTVASDHIKPIEASGTTTISLGDAATMGSGYQPTIVNVGTDTVTVALATDTDTLNGATNGSVTLAPNASTTFTVNNGANGYESIARVAKFATEVKQQIFTASGTYTPTTGMIYCRVQLQAAGGGGGGSVASAMNAGGGGGAGGYCEKIFSASDIGSSQPVTLGAAGAGVSGADGTDASNSTFGSLLSATGGSGGTVGTASAGANGGVGGVGSLGSINIAGQVGATGVGSSSIPISGAGGNSKLGLGGATGAAASLDVPGKGGTGFGAGGSGSLTVSAGIARTGGSGSGPVCIVTEFIAASS